MEQYMPFIWIGFAVVMAVCEAFTSQLVSIWFVLGAVCAALTTIFTPSLPIQSAVFLGVSFLTLAITRPLIRKMHKKHKLVNTNADRLIGRTGILLSDFDDCQSTAQARIDGEIWSIKSQYAPMHKDEKVKVLSIEGVKLVVEPVKQ